MVDARTHAEKPHPPPRWRWGTTARPGRLCWRWKEKEKGKISIRDDHPKSHLRQIKWTLVDGGAGPDLGGVPLVQRRRDDQGPAVARRGPYEAVDGEDADFRGVLRKHMDGCA